MAKKLKKLLPLIAAGIGASMLGRKGTAFGRPKRGSIDQMAADAAMPGNLSSDMGMKRKQFMPGIVDYGEMVGLKSGGMVVKSGDKAKKTKKKVGIQIKGFGKARKR